MFKIATTGTKGRTLESCILYFCNLEDSHISQGQEKIVMLVVWWSTVDCTFQCLVLSITVSWTWLSFLLCHISSTHNCCTTGMTRTTTSVSTAQLLIFLLGLLAASVARANILVSTSSFKQGSNEGISQAGHTQTEHRLP